MKRTSPATTRCLRRPLALLLAVTLALTSGVTAAAVAVDHDWTEVDDYGGQTIAPGETAAVKTTRDHVTAYFGGDLFNFYLEDIPLHPERDGIFTFTAPSLDGIDPPPGVTMSGVWLLYASDDFTHLTTQLHFTPLVTFESLPVCEVTVSDGVTSKTYREEAVEIDWSEDKYWNDPAAAFPLFTSDLDLDDGEVEITINPFKALKRYSGDVGGLYVFSATNSYDPDDFYQWPTIEFGYDVDNGRWEQLVSGDGSAPVNIGVAEVELPELPDAFEDLDQIGLWCVDEDGYLDSGDGRPMWSAEITPGDYILRYDDPSSVTTGSNGDLLFTGRIAFTKSTENYIADRAATFPADSQPKAHFPFSGDLTFTASYDPANGSGAWRLKSIWNDAAGEAPENFEILAIPVSEQVLDSGPSRRTSGGNNTRPFQFPIVSSAGEGGTIDPLGEDFYIRGGIRAVYTARPEEGYVVDKVLVDGKPVQLNADNEYVFTDIYGRRTIHVTFKRGSSDEEDEALRTDASSTFKSNPVTGGPGA